MSLDNTLNASIEIDDAPAIAAQQRVNRGFDSISESAQKNARQTSGYIDSMTAAIVSGAHAVSREVGSLADSFGGAVRKTGELALAIYGTVEAIKLLGGAFARATILNSQNAISGEKLVNTYRAVRLVLSPTFFTGFTIAAGVALEETLRLANARSKLLEQDALIAARTDPNLQNNLSLQQVEQLHFAARATGRENDLFIRASQALTERRENLQQARGLEALGLTPDAKRTLEDAPELLRKIGVAFEGITDPSQRARIAVGLFGEDLAGKILPALNSAFDENVRSFDAWGAGLSDNQAQVLSQFRQTVDSIKSNFHSLTSDVSAAGEAIKNTLATSGGYIGQFLLGDTRSWIREQKRRLSGAQTNIYGEIDETIGNFGLPRSMPELQRQLNEGIGPASEQAIRNVSAFSGGGQDAAVEALKQAREAIDRQRETRAGLEDSLGKATAQREAFAKDLQDYQQGERSLTPTQVLMASLGYQTANQIAAVDKATLDALKRGDDVKKHLSKAIRRSHELALEAQAQAFGPLGGALVKSQREAFQLSTFTNERGENVRFNLNEAIQANIRKAHAAEILEIQKKSLAEVAKRTEEEFNLEQSYQATLYQKRLSYDSDVTQRSLDNLTKLREYSLTTAEQVRDRRLQDAELEGVFGAQTIQQKTEAEQKKAAIEISYLRDTQKTREALFDAETFKLFEDERSRARQAGTDAVTASKNLNDLSEQREALRLQLSQNTDAAIAAAQQRSAITVAETMRSQYQSTFYSFKQSANGLIDAAFSRTGNLAKAILEAAVISPLKQIASSQIAATLFHLTTGGTVKFEGTKLGTGAFSDLRQSLGTLGLGQPIITPPGGTSKLDMPGHIGDVTLLNGAVPVMVVNPEPAVTAPAGTTGGHLFGALQSIIGLGRIYGGIDSGKPAVSSTISFPAAEAVNDWRALEQIPSLLSGQTEPTPPPGKPNIFPAATRSPFTGVPILFNQSTNAESLLGRFVPGADARIKIFSGNAEDPTEAIRTMVHEDVHALIGGREESLNALLPPEFVKKHVDELVQSGFYNRESAQVELIPRLIAHDYSPEETGSTLKMLAPRLAQQDAELAQKLKSMYGVAYDAYYGDARFPKAYQDYRVSPVVPKYTQLPSGPLNRYASAPPGVYAGAFPESGAAAEYIGSLPPRYTRLPSGLLDRFSGPIGTSPAETGMSQDLSELPLPGPNMGARAASVGMAPAYDISNLPLYDRETAATAGMLTASYGAMDYGYGHPATAAGGHGLLSSLGGLLGKNKDFIFNSGSIQTGAGTATTAAGIGGIAGGLAGFASSPAGLLIGSTLALDALKRKSSLGADVELTTGGALTGANIGSKIPGVGIGPGAAIGAGAGLFASGLKRGGAVGALEDVGGGALAGAGVGFAVGGPEGAVIGGVVGAVAGGIAGITRLFFHGAVQQVQDQIKAAYGLSVDKGTAQQILDVAKQKYHGSISIAIRSSEVLDLLELYASATGQPFAVRNRARPVLLAENAGQLQQMAINENGRQLAYQGLPVFNNVPTIPIYDNTLTYRDSLVQGKPVTVPYYLQPSSGAGQQSQPISLSLNEKQTETFLRGRAVEAMNDNPRTVVNAAQKAYAGNYGRRQTAAQQLEPDLVLG